MQTMQFTRKSDLQKTSLSKTAEAKQQNRVQHQHH